MRKCTIVKCEIYYGDGWAVLPQENAFYICYNCMNFFRTEARRKERERAQKIIEDIPTEFKEWAEEGKQEALKKLNNE